MEKNRLEAFSDGVLAIIITIMVLELSLPAGDRLKDLLVLAPTLLAYLLSFFFVAIYWVNHHLLFNLAETINVKILWCNIVWMFTMSFIPFTTAWVGKYPKAFAPLSIYFLDMFLACVSFHIMYYLIVKENKLTFKMSPRNIISLITYFAAATVGSFCPIAAYICVALVSAWWIFPEKKNNS
jgi:uncharacterized membrane protein